MSTKNNFLNKLICATVLLVFTSLSACSEKSVETQEVNKPVLEKTKDKVKAVTEVKTQTTTQDTLSFEVDSNDSKKTYVHGYADFITKSLKADSACQTLVVSINAVIEKFEADGSTANSQTVVKGLDALLQEPVNKACIA